MKRRQYLLMPNGSSLIELTCAIFVISVGLFGVIHIYMRGIEKMQAINEYEAVLCALNNELETLRALPWETLKPGNDLPFRSETPGLERLHLAETRTFINLEQNYTGLKRVTVRIRWIGEHGRRIEKELTTLITRVDATGESLTNLEEYADASRS